jgi:anti-sigma regulatory factor (Ser/Thr protein kinase)
MDSVIPMGAQVVAVVRMEDASVSHDRLLTVSAHAEPGPGYLPPGLADVQVCQQAVHAAASCTLPAHPGSARRAREFTRVTLQDWGTAAPIDVAELVVSELVTNALRHGLLSARWMPGEHPIRLTLLRRSSHLVCLVTDPDGTGPVKIDPGISAENGRGLQVVECCSVRWGWEPVDGTGKVVWALLRLSALRRTTGRTGRHPPSLPPGLPRSGEQVVEFAVLDAPDERIDLSGRVDQRGAVRVPGIA